MKSRTALWCTAALLPALAWATAPRLSDVDAAPRERPYDLDLALPPGTPLDWSGRLPHTPVSSAPTTPADSAVRRADGSMPTVSTAEVPDQQRVSPSSFGLLRILTWDLTAHVGWLGEVDREQHSFTRGGGELPYPPVVRRPFWWMTMAPLLRLLLHPQFVSTAETEALLLEIGEAVIPALEAARSESALAPLCDDVLRLLGKPGGSTPTPLRGKDPQQTMWLRFVAEQLIERHPHDPELGFGERLYLFGPRVVPSLIAYLDHDNAFLRRNAVVALERVGGREALEALDHLVESTKDPVQWCRAVMALGRHRAILSLPRLQALLAEERSPWRSAVLIHALGLIGDPRAMPAILKRAALRKADPDLMMTALVALSRLPQREAPPELRAFLDVLRREPSTRWRLDPPPPAYVPDRPDPSDARFDLLMQLAYIARSAAEPANEELSQLLISWLGRGDLDAPPQLWRGYESATGTLHGIAAPARLVYLDQLARLGAKGRDALHRVARDGMLDPQLRAHALRHVSSDARGLLAAELASEPNHEGLLRVAALDNLDALRSAELERVARRIAEEALGERNLDALEGPQRFLVRRAIEVLGAMSSKSEGSVELLLQLAALDSVPDLPSARVEDALRDQIAAIVALVAEKRSVRSAAREIEDVLDIVIAKHLSPIVRESTRDPSRARLIALLEGARSSRDAKYLETVVDTIHSELLGRVVGVAQAELQFALRVPLEDSLCFALARCHNSQTLHALVRRLRDPQHAGRALAALALGGVDSRIVLPHLLAALEDRDAFVRFCAAAALEQRTGATNTCDWLMGDAAAQKAGVYAWRQIAEKN